MVLPYEVSDVFTPGRMPDVTYNPRNELDVEGQLRAFWENRGAALTLSGPTKSGKTVVVERVFPQGEALWVPGSDLTSIDDLWRRVIDFFGLFEDVQSMSGTSDRETAKGGASLGLPYAGVQGELISEGGSSSELTLGASRPVAAVARKALLDMRVPIVIDDFHYVPDELKIHLVRAIKGLVAEIPVVMIAVPYDAFRAVREEPDMNGRVWHQEISPWSVEELLYIAHAGFRVLNLADPDDRVARELASASHGAPFLMQQLCLDYCRAQSVTATVNPEKELKYIDDWESFYQRIALRYIPGVFDNLRRGPRTKGQPRLPRVLKNGHSTDIYGAILYTLSRIGPIRDITTQRLTRAIGEFTVSSSAPTLQNVAQALGQMQSIAEKHKGSSDPALAYADDTLFISDPVLSFYLRFGKWELPSPPNDSI